MNTGQTPAREWNTRRSEKARRIASFPLNGKVIPSERATEALETLIAPGDRVVLKGITRNRLTSYPARWQR